MSRIQSTLFIVNQASGLGRAAAEANRLREEFDRAFAFIPSRVVEIATTHEQVRQATLNFLRGHAAPYLLLAGGGAGTSRAMIQGAMELVAQSAVDLRDIHFSSLRLGSGNVVPKILGISANPFQAMDDIAQGLLNEIQTDVCVYASAFCNPDGSVTREYGTTMGMFGPLGRVPAQVHAAKQKHKWLMSQITKIIPLEKITVLQYVGMGALTVLQATLFPGRADLVEIACGAERAQWQILAGFLLNFDLPQLPVRAECKVGEPSLTLILVPRENIVQAVRNLLDWQRFDRRSTKYRVTPTQTIDLTFLEADDRIVSLDEDTFVAPKRIRFEVAGTIKFVTSGVKSWL